MGLLCLWAVSGSCKLLALTQQLCPRQQAWLPPLPKGSWVALLLGML